MFDISKAPIAVKAVMTPAHKEMIEAYAGPDGLDMERVWADREKHMDALAVQLTEKHQMRMASREAA